MQTRLSALFRQSPEGDEADRILRSCVHCGFCTATCPTYQLLGDELDGPRGRIYLIKQMLEGGEVTQKTQGHLDRCLTCRACESTCPSGVQYGRLVDIGRAEVERRVGRPWFDALSRRILRAIIPYRGRFTPLLRLGQSLRPLLPATLRKSIPEPRAATPWPTAQHSRRMLMLAGCVQPGLAPNINTATARVLDQIGISVIECAQAGCCGAVSHHLNAHDEALQQIRCNIDAWWPEIEAGAEAVIITASGCGAMVKDYGHLLRHDPGYADKAAHVSSLAKDPVEILLEAREAIVSRFRTPHPVRIAFHAPCSLQHGQKLPGRVEDLLRACGFELTDVPDPHLCCGSAGTYSMLQPELSGQLRNNKLQALHSGTPTVIGSANIGCITHLQAGTDTPVWHWIEILEMTSPV